ncbi:T9SS type A sorting domain-containing protein [Microscilla marina]|nr:T9SS type A sorting domain-containing protein [Microscilla marina]
MNKSILPWLCLALVCALFCNSPVFSQNASNYGSPNSTQFATNATATLEDMSSGTTQLIGANQLNTSSSITPFGFEVWFMGKRFTDFSVNTNGVLQFGNITVATEANTHAIATKEPRISPLSSGTLLNLETAPITGSFKTAGTGKIHYKLVGTSPNRYLVIEWKDILLNHRNISGQTATFQAHIYETTPRTGATTEGGRIYFVYGEMPTDFRNGSNNGVVAQVHLGIGAGISPQNYLGLQVDGGIAAPIPNTTDNDGEANSANYHNIIASESNVPLLHTTVANSRRFINLEVEEVTGLPDNFQAICVTDTKIDLTWINPNVTNAVGAVLYRSTDNVNFSFQNQVPIGTNIYSDSGLIPGQTYYYHLYLVNEGKLSKLGGTASVVATTGATANYSVTSGKWSDASTWSKGTVPNINDDVVINCSDIVYVDTDASCRHLTVLITAKLRFANGGHTLVIGGNLNNEGVVDMNGSNTNLIVAGNINSSNSWMSGATATVTLNGTSHQTITNTGTSTIVTNSGSLTAASFNLINDNELDLGNNCSTSTANLPFPKATVRNISGYDPNLYNTLTGVTVNINHPANNELEIWVVPAGASTAYLLSADNGGSGANYTNVTFSDHATTAVSAYAGINHNFANESVRPQCQELSKITSAINADWQILVNDDDDTNPGGQLFTVSLNFESRSTVDELSFNNLIVQNTSTAGVTLAHSIRVTGHLTLTDGVVNTGNNEVIFNDNATASDGSNESYIDGVARKTGDDAFVFPVGNGGYIASIAITAPADPSDEFTAQYFHVAPATTAYDPNIKDDINLTKISDCEYWIINREVGASNVQVSLSYENTRSCGVGKSADLRIARWDTGSTRWENEGNGGDVTVGALNGIISSADVVNFSPFTLATQDPIGTPLPTGLLNFTVNQSKQGVLARWKALNDKTLAYYQLQRSTDGQKFVNTGQKITFNDAVNPVHQYSVWDKGATVGLSPVLYYRLKTVSSNGAYRYSQIKVLNFQTSYNIVSTVPNPFTDELTVNYTLPFEQTVSIEIRTLLGQTIQVYHQKAAKGSNQLQLSKLSTLPKGSYLLVLRHKDGTLTRTIVK